MPSIAAMLKNQPNAGKAKGQAAPELPYHERLRGRFEAAMAAMTALREDLQSYPSTGDLESLAEVRRLLGLKLTETNGTALHYAVRAVFAPFANLLEALSNTANSTAGRSEADLNRLAREGCAGRILHKEDPRVTPALRGSESPHGTLSILLVPERLGHDHPARQALCDLLPSEERVQLSFGESALVLSRNQESRLWYLDFDRIKADTLFWVTERKSSEEAKAKREAILAEAARTPTDRLEERLAACEAELAALRAEQAQS